MPGQFYPAWPDAFAKSNFPFDDTATLTALDGYKLFQAAFYDACFYGPNIAYPVYISSISVTNTSVTVNISDQDGRIGTGYWPAPDGYDHRVIEIKNSDDNIIGHLVGTPGVLLLISNSGTVEHEFAESATRFTLFTNYYFVSDVTTRQSTGILLPEQGDVYLVAGDGVQFVCSEDSKTINGVKSTYTKITINAVGDPLSIRNTCGDTFIEPRFIEEVIFQKNDVTYGCKPENLGIVNILSASRGGHRSVLRISSDATGINIGIFGERL